ncbi:MAG: ribosome recycling factor [Planctomycetota bacterium]
MDLSYDGIIADGREKMGKCVSYLEEELRGIRTGRASSALVETIRVDYYGSPTPIGQLAQISTPDPKTVTIKPFDATQVKAIEKAILAANIGITPSSDGKLIRLTVPALTEETRKKMAGKVKELAESQRVAIRNVRREANKHADQVKKDSIITEDDHRRLLDDIQEATKAAEKDIDAIAAAKAKEIMEI